MVFTKESAHLEIHFHREEVDLMSWEPEAIVQYLDERVALGNLMHGTGRNSFYLKPMPGYDVYRESGRQTAIYATDAVGQALKQAVYNKRLARSIATLTETTEVSGMSSIDGIKTEFAFMPQIYDAIINDRERSTNLLRDGFVFELPKRSFEPDPDVSTDYLSRQVLVPSRVYMIPRTVGYLLFGNINERFITRPYTEEKINEMREIMRREPPPFNKNIA